MHYYAVTMSERVLTLMQALVYYITPINPSMPTWVHCTVVNVFKAIISLAPLLLVLLLS
jgi:hypothetical protein